jgi:hypothetical protein
MPVAAVKEVIALANQYDYEARRVVLFRQMFYEMDLATGQKFDNLPPDSNIEALEVGH